jgi:hypothetical protein
MKPEAAIYRVVQWRKNLARVLSGKAIKLLRRAKEGESDELNDVGFGTWKLAMKQKR